MAKVKEKDKLTDRQLRFVQEYLIDRNGMQAAIRAGYAEKGAGVQAHWLLNNPKVKAEIARRSKVLEKKTGLDQERVRLEIARLAFSDPRRAFDPDGNLLPVQEWPDEVAAAISSIKVQRKIEVDDEGERTKIEVKEIKFWDKPKNLELAARHLGMLADKVEVTMTHTASLEELEAAAEAARKKAAQRNQGAA